MRHPGVVAGPRPSPLRPYPCSIVHLCLRKADQKLVILKQIPVEQMSKDERLAAQNECQVLKLLSHPNVIEYYENFLEDKALMIAMEYAPGGPRAPLTPDSGSSAGLRDARHSSLHASGCCGSMLCSGSSEIRNKAFLSRHGHYIFFCRKASVGPGGHQVGHEPFG